MPKKKPTADDRRQQWLADLNDEFRYEILLNESDRGAVLVASAFIEEALEHLLRQVLTVKSCNATNEKFPKWLNKLVNPSMDAPLGSFSARIAALFVIGVVDPQYLSALDALRELRNTYAHRKTDGSRPKLTSDSMKDFRQLILGPGVWDLRYVGLFPDDLDFDSTVAAVGVPRVEFALCVWIMLRSMVTETDWWKNNATVDTPIRSIPRFEGRHFAKPNPLWNNQVLGKQSRRPR